MKKEIINLNNLPSLKKLLIDYLQFNFNQDAIITDEYLIEEYQMLKKENRLDELFEQELLNNTGLLKEDFLWI